MATRDPNNICSWTYLEEIAFLCWKVLINERYRHFDNHCQQTGENDIVSSDILSVNSVHLNCRQQKRMSVGIVIRIMAREHILGHI